MGCPPRSAGSLPGFARCSATSFSDCHSSPTPQICRMGYRPSPPCPSWQQNSTLPWARELNSGAHRRNLRCYGARGLCIWRCTASSSRTVRSCSAWATRRVRKHSRPLPTGRTNTLLTSKVARRPVSTRIGNCPVEDRPPGCSAPAGIFTGDAVGLPVRHPPDETRTQTREGR